MIFFSVFPQITDITSSSKSNTHDIDHQDLESWKYVKKPADKDPESDGNDDADEIVRIGGGFLKINGNVKTSIRQKKKPGGGSAIIQALKPMELQK